MEEEKLSYPVPTVINGQLLSNEKGRSTASREVVQDVSKMNSVKVCRKDTKKSDMDTVLFNWNLCKKQVEHKIVILGDSHTRSLAGSLEGRKSHKILMIGDRHVRNCATKLQHNLAANYVVSSFVKSGARMATIVNTARDEIKNLRSEDVIVIWGGANGISQNNTKVAIKHVYNFFGKKKKKKNLNIVVMKSPHRCDEYNEYNDLNFENCTFGIHLELLESLNLLQPRRV